MASSIALVAQRKRLRYEGRVARLVSRPETMRRLMGDAMGMERRWPLAGGHLTGEVGGALRRTGGKVAPSAGDQQTDGRTSCGIGQRGAFEGVDRRSKQPHGRLRLITHFR